MDKLLNFCEKNYFRINGRHGTKIKTSQGWQYINHTTSKKGHEESSHNKSIFLVRIKKVRSLFKSRKKFIHFFSKQLMQRIKLRLVFNMHTNACGDFTLLSKSDWELLKGYPEIQGYSWHLDSYFLYQASLSGIKEVRLPRSHSIYHIEHLTGSGFTPEASNALFDRLKEKKISCLTDEELFDGVNEMRRKKKKKEPFTYNDNDWGFRDIQFPEVIF